MKKATCIRISRAKDRLTICLREKCSNRFGVLSTTTNGVKVTLTTLKMTLIMYRKKTLSANLNGLRKRAALQQVPMEGA